MNVFAVSGTLPFGRPWHLHSLRRRRCLRWLAGSLSFVILSAFFAEHHVSAMNGAVKEREESWSQH